jgi:hypothetical protein
MVQQLVQPVDGEAIRDLLRALEVVDLHEDIVGEREADLPFPEFAGQPVVPVEVNLQTVGRPGRHAHIAQPKLRVDEAKVEVHALAAVGPQERLVRLLVVPRLIGGTRLHHAEHVHQPGSVTTRGEDLLDPGFLPDCFRFPQVLDREPGLLGDPLRVLADPVAQPFGEDSKVEDLDALYV